MPRCYIAFPGGGKGLNRLKPSLDCCTLSPDIVRAGSYCTSTHHHIVQPFWGLALQASAVFACTCIKSCSVVSEASRA